MLLKVDKIDNINNEADMHICSHEAYVENSLIELDHYCERHFVRNDLVMKNARVLDANLAIIDSNNYYYPGGFSHARGWYKHKRVHIYGKEFFYKTNQKTYTDLNCLLLGPTHHYGLLFVDLFDKLKCNVKNYDKWVCTVRPSGVLLEALSVVLEVEPDYILSKVLCPPLDGELVCTNLTSFSNRSSKRFFSYETIQMLRNKPNILSILENESNETNIYIQRNGNIRRKLLFNAKQKSFFLKNNFILLDLLQLSFIEQVKYFSSARKIVLPIGSECYNLIFCGGKTKIYILVSETYLLANKDVVASFRSLAMHLNLKICFIGCKEVLQAKKNDSLHNLDLVVPDWLTDLFK